MEKKEEAYEFLKNHVDTENLMQHSLAVSKTMEKLASRLGEDEEKWSITGMLHDVDYEKTKDAPEQHSLEASKMLAEAGIDEEICHAVKAHNAHHEVPRKTNLDCALYSVDALTDLIFAAALLHPDKKLSSIDKNFVLDRYAEPSFARGSNRAQIAECQELGLNLEEFVDICLAAMQEIAHDLEP